MKDETFHNIVKTILIGAMATISLCAIYYGNRKHNKAETAVVFDEKDVVVYYDTAECVWHWDENSGDANIKPEDDAYDAVDLVKYATEIGGDDDIVFAWIDDFTFEADGFTYVFKRTEGTKYTLSDESIRALVKSGRLCDVIGHCWNNIGVGYRECGVCGRMERESFSITWEAVE